METLISSLNTKNYHFNDFGWIHYEGRRDEESMKSLLKIFPTEYNSLYKNRAAVSLELEHPSRQFLLQRGIVDKADVLFFSR